MNDRKLCKSTYQPSTDPGLVYHCGEYEDHSGPHHADIYYWPNSKDQAHRNRPLNPAEVRSVFDLISTP